MKPELIQAKLAGVVRGAYTSANRDRPGLLVSPAPIVVFVDDIQDLPWESQSYLLDCLEGKPLRPEGGVTPFIPDVRWVIGSMSPWPPWSRTTRCGATSRPVAALWKYSCFRCAFTPRT